MNTSKKGVITDVEGVYTGVQDVDIELYDPSDMGDITNSVYTVYDDDNYIIASHRAGRGSGQRGQLRLHPVWRQERGEDRQHLLLGVRRCCRGEIVTLTAQSKYDRTIDDLQPGHVQELRYTGEYVTAIKDVDADDIYHNNTKKIVDEEVYDVGHDGSWGQRC